MRNLVGHRVKAARRRAKPKITQQQLAAKLQLLDWNISQVGVAKIESGLRAVNEVELRKLSKALGVKIAWLVEEEDG